MKKKIVTVIERNDRVTTGELLFYCEYPHAVFGNHYAIERFEQRPQRVTIKTTDGRVTSFTVPKSVII